MFVVVAGVGWTWFPITKCPARLACLTQEELKNNSFTIKTYFHFCLGSKKQGGFCSGVISGMAIGWSKKGARNW